MGKLVGFAVVATALTVSGCMGCTNIEPGHVGVMVKRCSGGGVEPQPLPIGYQFRNLFCEEIVEYPVYQQTMVLARAKTQDNPDESITVASSEGLPINVDVSLSFTLDTNKVPSIYGKYRRDLEHIQSTFFKQTIREGLQKTFAKYTAEQLYSTEREHTRVEVQTFLTERLGPDGFHVTQFTINETRPPEQVINAIKQKVSMVQEAMRAEQEVRKSEAEAKQRVAQAKGLAEAAVEAAEGEAKSLRAKADAQAYYNQKVSQSLTPTLVQSKAIEKWDGALPHMNGSGGIPFIVQPANK